MKVLKYLIEKEFKQFGRNPFIIRLALLFPIMVMLIFPWVATLDITGVNIDIVDNDRSETSKKLIEKIEASTYFKLHAMEQEYRFAFENMKYGKSDIILEIPEGFEKDLINGVPCQAGVFANAVDGTKGALGSSYLASIVNGFAAEQSGTVQEMPVKIKVQNRYNPTLNYRFYMIPAIMIILIILICGFLPALNIVSEKEIGTIEQINVTPVGKYQFILAKMIPFWIMGITAFSLCFALAYWIYGLIPAGSLLTVYGASLIFVLAMSGMGLIISNYSATMQQSMFLMFFFVMIFLLMSGLFTPVSSMPDWAQWIAVFNPPRYIVEIMRGVYLKGSSFADLKPQFAALTAFAVFLSAWAILSYRKRN